MPRHTPYGVASIFRSALTAGQAPRVFQDGAQRRDFVSVHGGRGERARPALSGAGRLSGLQRRQWCGARGGGDGHRAGRSLWGTGAGGHRAVPAGRCPACHRRSEPGLLGAGLRSRGAVRRRGARVRRRLSGVRPSLARQASSRASSLVTVAQLRAVVSAPVRASWAASSLRPSPSGVRRNNVRPTTRASSGLRSALLRSPDEARVVGRTLFLRTPDGLGRSELAAQLARTGADTTARNWATVTKLLALLDA